MADNFGRDSHASRNDSAHVTRVRDRYSYRFDRSSCDRLVDEPLLNDRSIFVSSLKRDRQSRSRIIDIRLRGGWLTMTITMLAHKQVNNDRYSHDTATASFLARRVVACWSRKRRQPRVDSATTSNANFFHRRSCFNLLLSLSLSLSLLKERDGELATFWKLVCEITGWNSVQTSDRRVIVRFVYFLGCLLCNSAVCLIFVWNENAGILRISERANN